jgi:Acetyltransferases, including N-acetylases of ribosomal proteins
MRNYNFKNFDGIETDNLQLRKLSLSDSKDIFEFTSNPITTEYLTWYPHQDVNTTKEFIVSVIKKYEENLPSQWAIVKKEVNKVVGITGFITVSYEHLKGEVAFVLSPEVWGQGIMKEALLQVYDFGFNILNLVRIEAKADTENNQSAKALIKSGMKYEGTLRNYLIIKNKQRSFNFYSILNSEYVQK